MKEYFENEIKPIKLVIRSSPFIRCVMTACAISGQLGKGNKYPNVEIDGFNSETLSSYMYDCNPIPDLEIYKCRSENDIDKLKRKYKIDQKIKIKIGQEQQKGIE